MTNQTDVHMVGIPYDLQDDDFYIASWGFEDLPEDQWPDYIQL